MKNLPKAITFSQFPSITDYDNDGEEDVDVFIAEQDLGTFATVSGTDKTLGLRDKDVNFYIGNMEPKIKENNMIVGYWEYDGTPGLWELIVATTADDNFLPIGLM